MIVLNDKLMKVIQESKSKLDAGLITKNDFNDLVEWAITVQHEGDN